MRKLGIVVVLVVGVSVGWMLGISTLSETEAQTPLPHFKCYGIQGHDPGHVVGLANQFGREQGVRVGRAIALCLPTKKRVEHGPEAPTRGTLNHLKCYVIQGKDPRKRVDLRNQFGVEKDVTVREPRLLCVPTQKRVRQPADRIIDLDGIATTSPGGTADRQVTLGAALSSFPTGFGPEGLDMFDNDGNAAWTFGAAGDDLHLEDPNGTCNTGIRNGVHDVGQDCKVLDIDGGLANGQPVSCDLETGTFCPAGLPDNIRFHDADGNGFYDNAEDIVLDVNGNGIFD